MGTRSLIFLVPLLSLTGCVVTYGNFPDVRADALPKHQVSTPLSYYVGGIPTTIIKDNPAYPVATNVAMTLFPNLYPLGMKDWRDAGREVIGKTLETSGMFSEVLAKTYPLPDPIHQGLHIDVTFIVVPPSKWAEAVASYQALPVLAAYVFPPAILLFPLAWDPIPYYSGEGGLRVLYALYRDGARQSTYLYIIKKKGWGGILLLPLAWLNFFTDDLKDGLRATTLQFLIDAHRDGNL